MAWIESHQELLRHPKTRRLARALGEAVPTVIGRLHCLWWWAVDYAQDGDLSLYSDADLADAVLWEGDAAELVGALMSAGFVDADRRIHDWDEYAGRLIERRRQDAERKRTARGQSAPSGGRPADVRRTSGVTVPNRTVPVPDLTGPEEAKDSGVVVVVSAPDGAGTPPRRERREPAPTLRLSEDARTVLDGWRAAFGKRAPPKLNPTQVSKLEEAVADLGVPRLLESARWCAAKGLAEFPKTLRAAYTKRQQDEAQEHRNGYGNGRPRVDSLDALAAYDE